MKQYVIDDLRGPEMRRFQEWCGANLAKTCFSDVFWLHLDETVLSPVQAAHAACRPFYLSLTLETDACRVVVDLAVRTARSMHCECMGYVTTAQWGWLDDFISGVFAGLNIKP